MDQQRLGWKNGFGTGKGDTPSRVGFEGAWTPTPTQWDNSYLDTAVQSTGSSPRARPAASSGPPSGPRRHRRPDAHDPSSTHAPMMSTADMAMKMDPIYGPISQRFRDDPSASPTPSRVRGTS